MLQTKELDLEDILMDLEAMSALLEVVRSSEYYKNTEEIKVYKALQNCVEHTKEKMEHIMEGMLK